MLKPNPAFAGRIPALDGIRGVAILMVVIYHYCVSNGTLADHGWQKAIYLPISYGWAGVDLFFVLSGFLISGILLDARDDRRYYAVFYGRRSLRILPVYFVVLLVSVAGRWVTPTAGLPLWTYFLFVQNIAIAICKTWGAPFLGATWSLAVEEQFYLLIAPLFRKVQSERILIMATALLILLPPVFRLLWTAFREPYFGPYVLLAARADSLGFGIAVAIAIRSRSAWDYITRHVPLIYAAGLLLLIPGFALWYELPTQGALKRGIGFSIIAAVFAMILLSTLIRHAAGRSLLLTWPPLCWLGSVSYAVYLLHEGFLEVAASIWRGAAHSGVPALAALAATLAVAEASRRWFEGPILRFGRSKFRYAVEGRSRPLADAVSS